MAKISNPWIGYLDRDYFEIKDALLGKVTNSNPEMTDHSESNIFVIIISMFAAIAEMLGYYIDNVAQESFLATAERRSSVIRHTRAHDYRIRARHPEEVDLSITWSSAAHAAFVLSAGLTIDSEDGIRFTLLEDQNILLNAPSSVIPIAQIAAVDLPNAAVTNGTQNQRVSLGTTYVHKTSQVLVDSVEFSERDTFAFSKPTDNHYIIDIDEDGNAYIVFGDGVRAVKPNNGLTIALQYRTTLGPEGKVGAGGFDPGTITPNSALPGGLAITGASTVEASSGGSLYEETEQVRTNAILRVRTNDRMVNRQDHVDILQMVSGVAKAGIHFCCGKTIDLYIVPQGGGVASTGLITAAQAVADDKKMVCTFPKVRPAGETRLVLKATVTARKRKSTIDTKTQVVDALVAFGLLENQEINGAIRLSDLQALIDNLSNVDYVELTGMYTIPYARPVNHTTALSWTNETLAPSIINTDWKLEYDGANFRLFRNNVFQGNVSISSTYVSVDGSFTFKINPGVYVNGQQWTFKTYPYLKNLQLVDFTIFTIKETDLTLNVVPSTGVPSDEC